MSKSREDQDLEMAQIVFTTCSGIQAVDKLFEGFLQTDKTTLEFDRKDVESLKLLLRVSSILITNFFEDQQSFLDQLFKMEAKIEAKKQEIVDKEGDTP